MDYPNNFNIPAFPAGKTIALTRSVSVWILIVFFLIVAACCFILLGNRFKTNYPFLISVDPITDEWTVVAYPNEEQKTLQQYEIFQEKLINDFVVNWFTVSNNQTINDARWTECSIDECKCSDKDCENPEFFDSENLTCALACRCNSDVFKDFQEKVLPTYKESNETWNVIGKQILPIFDVSENGGKWQVYITVQNPESKRYFNVLGFVDVDRDVDSYSATFGYYIKQFNAYRVTK